MTPIVTLTGNLLAERTFNLATAWREGATQRASEESFQVGGKGFNVAKMLHRLGVPVTALGFAGGATGAECEAWLAAQATYAYRLFPAATATRTGLVLRAPGRAETTFLAPDRGPGAEALAACARHLDTLGPAPLLALCGSFPGWSDAETRPLREALQRRARAGRLVVDSYGPPLADLVREPVRLVKINRNEFDQLGPEAARGQPVEDRLRQALQDLPVQGWIVTDGAGPVWLAGPDGVHAMQPPAVTEVSATGSGDVLLAAVLATWFSRRESLAEALRFALPLAAANAASGGVGDFPLPSIPPRHAP